MPGTKQSIQQELDAINKLEELYHLAGFTDFPEGEAMVIGMRYASLWKKTDTGHIEWIYIPPEDEDGGEIILGAMSKGDRIIVFTQDNYDKLIGATSAEWQKEGIELKLPPTPNT